MAPHKNVSFLYVKLFKSSYDYQMGLSLQCAKHYLRVDDPKIKKPVSCLSKNSTVLENESLLLFYHLKVILMINLLSAIS